MKGVIRFERKGKLALRCIRPFKILQKFRNVFYKVDLYISIEKIYLVFYFFMLRKLVSSPHKVLSELNLEIIRDLTYVKQPVSAVDTQIKNLRNKKILKAL